MVDSIVVAGVVRNVSSLLCNELEKVISAFNFVNIVKIFLVESDSSDNTVELLYKLKQKYDNFDFISLGDLRDKIEVRTERLAYCRNQYLGYFEKHNYFSAKYLFVSDFDGVNSALCDRNMKKVFQFLERNPNAAACANQSYKYYDIWALRHPVWSPNDCWYSYHIIKEQLGCKNAHFLTNLARMIKIDQNNLEISVESAFGGGVIYPVTYLKGCYYEGLIGQYPVCEHVKFSAFFISNGGRLYIVPYFINHDVSRHVLDAEAFVDEAGSQSLVQFFLGV